MPINKTFRYIPAIMLLLACRPAFARQGTSLRDSTLPVKRLSPGGFFHSSYTKQLCFPSALSIAGLLSNGNGHEGLKMELVEERNEHMAAFHTPVDNYLQFSPILVAYGLDALGVPSRTDIANRTAILLKGEAVMLGTVFAVKHFTHQLRPDGSTNNSFPSGHTAQAFAAATFLSEEYKGRFPWMPYAAYGLASSVGALRMANNRHYISDVLLGAGIGILSVKAAYWTHQYRWAKKHQPPAQF